MGEPIIHIGENGELDQDEDGNVVLRNTATGVEIVLSDVVEGLATDPHGDEAHDPFENVLTEDIQNVATTEGDVEISHRYFYGPDDPRDEPDIEVRDGDVWYDTSDLG